MKGHTRELLDWIIASQHLKNDAALSRALGLTPPVICKLRSGRLPLGATHLIRMHEVFDLPIRRMKGMVGLRCLPCVKGGSNDQ